MGALGNRLEEPGQSSGEARRGRGKAPAAPLPSADLEMIGRHRAAPGPTGKNKTSEQGSTKWPQDSISTLTRTPA